MLPKMFAHILPLAALATGAASAQSAVAGNSSATWSINCGLWRTDSGFISTIDLKNRNIKVPITVTPILYMADGTEVDLTPITLPPAGVSTLKINDAIQTSQASAPAAHTSTYGSATLRVLGPQASLLAQTVLGSTSLSLSYNARFTGIASGAPGSQVLEGMWWARDSGMGGFLSLSNATASTKNVTVQVLAGNGQSQPSQAFSLPPHANQMLNLITLVGAPLTAGSAGGLRVQFTGSMGEVNVTAGLENRAEGYSAVMPFWVPPMAGMSPSAVTLGFPGIMVGAPDPSMGFPSGTSFSPYLAFRNVTPQSVSLALTLYTEQGVAVSVPAQSLQAFESRQVDLNGALKQTVLKAYSGMLTLAVSHNGQINDVLAVAGSVDAGGTYVFEVEGRPTEQSLSKQSTYWTTGDGSDTMVALWNPSSKPEDVVVTLSYQGGPNHYDFKVHLAAFGSANFGIKELIANQAPDALGNVVPPGTLEGNLIFHSANDIHSPISLNVNVGIFNVVKGTCTYTWVVCDGYTGVTLNPNSLAMISGDGVQVHALATYDDGSQVDYTYTASWSTTNSAIASVSAGYVTAGGTEGSATITGSVYLPLYGTYWDYNPNCSKDQPYQWFSAQTVANVCNAQLQPSDRGVACSSTNATSVTFNLRTTCTVTQQFGDPSCPTYTTAPNYFPTSSLSVTGCTGTLQAGIWSGSMTWTGNASGVGADYTVQLVLNYGRAVSYSSRQTCE